MPRKTVPVAPLLDKLNFALSRMGTIEERRTLCMAIETILFEAGAYKGFQYIGYHGEPIPHSLVQSGDYDEYRRRYFV